MDMHRSLNLKDYLDKAAYDQAKAEAKAQAGK